MSEEQDDMNCSMFAIGDARWPGVSKVIEELAELIVVLGKLMGTRGETNHWSGDLNAMLHEEAADALAAIGFMVDKCGLDWSRIDVRMAMKRALYEKWHAGDNDAR